MEAMVLGPLLQVFFDRLATPIVQKFQSCVGVKEEIDKLRLCTLQTLNLSRCNALLMLPSTVTKLTNLRHLNIKDCNSLMRMPAFLGKLRNLQTLPVFIVGSTDEEGLSQISGLRNLRGEFQSCVGVKEEIDKLRHQLPMIQAIIEDAEQQQVQDRRVQIWLNNLRDVIDDADELLDELSPHVRPTTEDEVINIICGKYLKLPPKLKRIGARFGEAIQEMSEFHFSQAVFKRPETKEIPEKGPEVDETQVYGRETDVHDIVEILLSSINTHITNASVMVIGELGESGKQHLPS